MIVVKVKLTEKSDSSLGKRVKNETALIAAIFDTSFFLFAPCLPLPRVGLFPHLPGKACPLLRVSSCLYAGIVISVTYGGEEGLSFGSFFHSASCPAWAAVLRGHNIATAIGESLKCQIWWEVDVNADLISSCKLLGSRTMLLPLWCLIAFLGGTRLL